MLLVLGSGIPAQTYWVRWVLSVLGSGVPTHILGVSTISPRASSTHTYTRCRYSQSEGQEYPHICWGWVLSILGPGVPAHILSPRIRGTHQHTYTPWFNYVGTLSPRIRGTRTNVLSKVDTLSPRMDQDYPHIYQVGTPSLKMRGTHQRTYTPWFIYVGTPSPRTRDTRTHVLSKVGALSPRITDTHTNLLSKVGTINP